VWLVTFSPDGKQLVTTSTNTRLYSAFDPDRDLIRLACRHMTRGLTISQEESYGLPASNTSKDRERVPPPPQVTIPPHATESTLSLNETIARLCAN
jgi:hypothetical protein